MRTVSLVIASAIILIATCGIVSAQTSAVNDAAMGTGADQTQPALLHASQSSQAVSKPPVLDQPVHIVPFREPGTATASAFAIAGAHADYFGGPVISNVHFVQVLYGPGAYLSNVSSTTRPSIATFLADIAQSSFLDMLNEYNTVGVPAADGLAGSNQTIGHGFFDGQFSINPSPANNGSNITDQQIQNELLAQVSSGNLPAPVLDAQGNPDTIYMVYFPPGKTISLGSAGSCVRGGFCAYHSSTVAKFGSKSLYYGVFPDTQPPSLCSSGCGSSIQFDIVTNVASHELAEAITDADVGNANVLGRPLAWVDPVNSEVGDICVGLQSSLFLNGTLYTVQREFSNFQTDCVATPAQFQISGGLTLSTGQQFDMPATLQSDSGAANVGYTGTVHFTSTDPLAILPADYTFNFADAGFHRFIATLKTAGTQSITMTDTKLPLVTGKANYTVNVPGAANFTVAAPANAVPGTPIQVVVAAMGGFPSSVAVGYTGTVHFTSSDASAVLPADSTLINGMKTFSVTFNTAGSQSLQVVDTANNQLFGNSGSLVAAAAAKPTATSVVQDTNPAIFGQTVSFTATATQGGKALTTGSITFSIDGATIQTLPVDLAGQVQGTFGLEGGPHTIFANYLGGGVNPDSSSGPLAVVVNPVATTITIASTSPSVFGTKIFLSAHFSNSAGGVNGGFVTFSDGGTPIAVVAPSFNLASFADASLAVGSHVITASYSGTPDFTAASAAPFTQVITPAPPLDYNLSANKTSATLLAGQSTKFAIAAISLSGFSGSVKFACGNLPAFTTCTFSPSSSVFVNASSPSVSTVLTVKTSGPNAFLSAPPDHRRNGTGSYASLWPAGPIIFGAVFLAGIRRKRPAFLVFALAACALVSGISSCGGGSSAPPPPPPPPQITPSGTTSMTISATGTPTSGSASPANPSQQLNISITVQ